MIVNRLSSLQDNHRRALSASSVERLKPFGTYSEVRASSAKSGCPSDHSFRIQTWLNEKSVRNIQVVLSLSPAHVIVIS